MKIWTQPLLFFWTFFQSFKVESILFCCITQRTHTPATLEDPTFIFGQDKDLRVMFGDVSGPRFSEEAIEVILRNLQKND